MTDAKNNVQLCVPITVAGKIQCARCDKKMTEREKRLCFINNEKAAFLKQHGPYSDTPAVTVDPSAGDFTDPNGVGSIYKAEVESWGGVGCTSCAILSHEMNLRGPDWCEKNIDMLVEKSYKYATKNASVIGTLAKFLPGVGVKSVIRLKLNAAIAECRKRKNVNG